MLGIFETPRTTSAPRVAAGVVLAAAALVSSAACGAGEEGARGAGGASMAATEYWVQPDTTVIGMGDPSDVKALSRDNVWVADRAAATIFSLSPKTDRYVGIGMGEHDPVEVRFPVKIAVDPEIGLAAYDGETKKIDLFTIEGELIRSFEPSFVPAMMSFSREPIGYTFGIAPEDSAGVRRPVVVRTDMRGEVTDTLLAPGRGPEALRSAVARPGETALAPSRTGMWVWSRTAPDTVFELSPRETLRLVLRDADTTAVTMLSDPVREMLWMIHTDSTFVTTYSAYDTGSLAYLGERTVSKPFRPAAIYDGVLMGFQPVRNAFGMIAWDLHVERFKRG